MYATRLVKAGVPVVHRRLDGQLHGFFTQVGILPGSERAIAFIAGAIRDQLLRPQANRRVHVPP